jgi:hypothetical protein
MDIIMKIYSTVECKEYWMSGSLFTLCPTRKYSIELMANLPWSKACHRCGICAALEIEESNLVETWCFFPSKEYKQPSSYLEESIYTDEWERAESSLCVTYAQINYSLYSVYLVLVRQTASRRFAAASDYRTTE